MEHELREVDTRVGFVIVENTEKCFLFRLQFHTMYKRKKKSPLAIENRSLGLYIKLEKTSEHRRDLWYKI